jgi:hypothetical protein
MLNSPWLTERFDESGKTPVRILIVADGRLSFNDTDEFGLSEFVNENLRPNAMPWEDLTVTTAHRQLDGTGADKPGFRFDTADPPVTIEHYDQVWLFGFLGEKKEHAIQASELRVLAEFMNNGGGVFATGDHADLGAALCGKVPRVQSMRKWFTTGVPPILQAPDRNNATRIDTVRIGRDAGFQTSDEADDVPQEIRPVFKVSKDGKRAEPHLLLARGNFAVTVLPDHMHEGECILPPDLNASLQFDGGDTFDEFPPLLLNNQERLSPEVVAVSTSAGGFLSVDPDIKPVFPRCYYIIVAYDGHSAGRVINSQSDGKGVGRVVVDASFHHFANRNLKGTGTTHKGFYDCNGNPTEDYLAIKQYFRNIVTWLCPPEKQKSYYRNLLLSLRYLAPLAEELSSTSKPSEQELLFIGASARKMITERFSRVEATQCALFAASSMRGDNIRAATENLFAPASLSDSNAGSIGLILDTEMILNFFLGGAMNGIAKNLPISPAEAFQSLAAADTLESPLESFIASGVEEGLASLSNVIERSNDALRSFSTTLNNFLN